MEVFKVVHKNTRYGSNAAHFIRSYGNNMFDDLLTTNEKLKPYFPIYKIGEYVECVPKSLGIMCFYTRTDAERLWYKGTKIIRVIIDEKNLITSNWKSVRVIRECGSSPENLLLNVNDPELDYAYSPRGTIFAKKVYVIE